ncbi:hemin importer ATP-binding subunit [Acinetobacter baumannii]|uniref:AAA family ATPase n=1 Tax=Acinetobacter calcoaceticus/baumannii complex TaxID=909768 RepID=UPI000DE6E7F0|nr:AAA family ATPase [Acinetobacter baumannii]MCT9498442.1 AAA family ATPase [Acinetobacter baumannii]SST43056.1 hemin importer ATP-binding subunit [Acinetobacter baumannii]
MIIGVFLRHIKTYKGINFIPISDGSSFCGLVGENGVGKSTVLESLDSFFHHKEWNINIEHISKTDANTPYIIPIFLIEKNKLKLSSEEESYVEKIDQALRSNNSSDLPAKSKDIGLKAFEHIQKIIENLENHNDYYFIALGLNKDNTKTFGLFKNTIISYFEEDDLPEIRITKKIEQTLEMEEDEDEDEDFVSLENLQDENIDEDDDEDDDEEKEGKEDKTSFATKILNGQIIGKIFHKIIGLYNYIYIPKELTAEEFTKLHNREFEVLMGKTLNETLEGFIGKTLVNNINNKLDTLVNSINEDLNFYTYKTPQTRQQKLRKTDIYKLITDAYFGIRQIHQDFDGKPIPITKLSSGEKQKAILNIASILLEKNHPKNVDKYIIFAFDEPESSLHISACFDIFQQLHKTSTFCNQLIFTTHWYGFLPAVLDGCTVIISKDKKREHLFDFVNLYKYREETKQLRKQSNRQQQFPSSIRLKSINDLVQSIICGSMSDNPFNWIICEGSSDKIILSHFLKELIDDKNLRILPLGGREEVKQLYSHLSIAFKDFDSEISGKVFLLCDTDSIANTQLFNDAQHKKLLFRRLINDSKTGTTRLVHINDLTQSEPTELEDVLNSETFIKTLESFKDKYPDVLEDLIEDNYSSLEENTFTPSAWAFRFSSASPQRKKIFSIFNITEKIKSEFAYRYIDNVENENDLPWIEEIKKFFKD